MQRKTVTIEAMDESGKGLARLGSLSGIDHDEDTYDTGAFMWKGPGADGLGGQWAQVLPCHDWRAMPFGKARVYEQGDAILADFQLNLDCQAGQDWHAALKFDLAKGQPIQEWSYGFNVIEADYQIRGDNRVRVLKRLDVMEISPVLRGAGIGTGTVALKNAALKDDRFAALVTDLGALGDALKGEAAPLSATGVKQLGEIHAALGDALKALSGEAAPGPDGMVDAVLGSYLKGLARRHLAAG